MLKLLNCMRSANYVRSIHVCRIRHNSEDSEQTSKQFKRKVTETVELVQLVDQDDKILGLKPKKEAELLARKLNLSLESVTDTKYGKMYPAYKMFSSADLLKTDKPVTTAKVLKKLPLNSRISDNDLSLKLKTVRKWLAKKCEVHIAILKNNESETQMKTVFSQIEEQLKNEVRIINIRHKEEAIKFILLPPKETAKKHTSKNNDIKENAKQEI